jgi:hypothetical protein
MNEHAFQFAKAHLELTAAGVRIPEQADWWVRVVMAASAQMLARPLAADLRRPWEKPLGPARPLSPGRVRRGFPEIRPQPCELAGDGGGRDAVRLAAGGHLLSGSLAVAAAPSRTGPACPARPSLAAPEPRADPGPVPVGLRGLHQRSPHPFRAGLGDRAAPGARPAGVLAGDQPGEPHERPRAGEPAPVDDLGGERERGQLRDPR